MRLGDFVWTILTAVGLFCLIVGLTVAMSQAAYAVGHFEECDDNLGCALHDCPSGGCNSSDAGCGCTLLTQNNEEYCLCGVSTP